MNALKVACLFAWVLAVVATPARAPWAFALHAATLLCVARAVRLPFRSLMRGLLVEIPFVLFALALPFVANGPQVHVLGLPLSVDGCWAAWEILAKATLGIGGAVVFRSTTAPAQILEGLEGLHVPAVMVAIAGFMIRYLHVVSADLRRLQIARISRGDDPRWLWQGRAIAATAGTVFVRSFERGERVHAAMLARGFDGQFAPSTATREKARWWPTSAVPTVGWAIALIGLMAR